MAGSLLEEEPIGDDNNSDDEDEKKLKEKKKREEEAEEAAKAEEVDPVEKQREIDAFMNSYLGVLKKGSYVKITVKNVLYKHYRNFTPTHPLVLARINPGEDNFGFLKVRIKKHRWYNSLLKTLDPLIFSVGWRRY